MVVMGERGERVLSESASLPQHRPGRPWAFSFSHSFGEVRDALGLELRKGPLASCLTTSAEGAA